MTTLRPMLAALTTPNRTFAIRAPLPLAGHGSGLVPQAGPVFSRTRFGADPDAFREAVDDPEGMSFGTSTQDGAVEYAVAWSDAEHRRHPGRARVDGAVTPRPPGRGGRGGPAPGARGHAPRRRPPDSPHSRRRHDGRRA